MVARLHIAPGTLANAPVTNYVGNEGWFVGAANATGIVLSAIAIPPITIASVTDGTSNTMIFSENYYTAANTPNGPSETSWHVAGYGFETLQPPNWQVPNQESTNPASFHPGGVNAAFADGSVHFIKTSINSWPVTAYESPPDNWFSYSYYTNSAGQFAWNAFLTPLAKLGVWQAISTRNGGEVVSSDSY